MIRLGIIGQPVHQSLSPRIHKWLSLKTNDTVCYEAIETTLSDLPSRLIQLEKDGFVGVNVTSPLKTEVIPFVHQLDKIATMTESLNTIRFEPEGQRVATNTDVFGFAHQFGGAPCKRVAILGAGGVVPSILFVLTKVGVDEVCLFNRSSPSNQVIKKALAANQGITYAPLKRFAESAAEFDVVIHCLPHAALPSASDWFSLELQKETRFIDLNYGATARVTRAADWFAI